MSYSIKTIPKFEKNLKKLAKKYPSLKIEYTNLLKTLRKDPQQGVSLGNSCYKIRLAIASKSKGKSGGARVITNFVVTGEVVFLLSIYDKSNKENITDKELKELLQYVPN